LDLLEDHPWTEVGVVDRCKTRKRIWTSDGKTLRIGIDAKGVGFLAV
jgi:hypothetical protein